MFTHSKTLAVLAAGALLLGGCNGREQANSDQNATPPAEMATSQGSAQIRLVNVLPSQSVTLFADSTQVATASANQAGSWQTVPATAVDLKVVLPGGSPDSAAAKSSKELDANQRYTALVLPPENPDDQPKLTILQENYQPPEEGKARLRIINVITPGQSVDIYAQGNRDPIVSGVDYESDTGLNDVQPVTGNLLVRPSDSKTTLTTIRDVKLVPGVTYTFLLTGTPKNVTVMKLGADSAATGADTTAHDSDTTTGG